MFFRTRLAALALCLLPAFWVAPAAQATTVGLPILTTEPGTIFFVNQFGPDLLPTPSFTMTYTGVIATAEGASELVGKSIFFRWFFDGGFDDGTVFTQLIIDGFDLSANKNLVDQYRMFISPPVDTDTPVTPTTSLFTYLAPFTGYGPFEGEFPERELLMEFSGAIPTKTGYIYCTIRDPNDCEFSTIPGLTEIGGRPVFEERSFDYPEGQLTDATVTFSTIDGFVAPVPLPATGLLLVAGLGALVAARRRRAAA